MRRVTVGLRGQSVYWQKLVYWVCDFLDCKWGKDLLKTCVEEVYAKAATRHEEDEEDWSDVLDRE